MLKAVGREGMGPNVPSVQPDGFPDNRQSKSCSAQFAATPFVGAEETLVQVWKALLRNPGAVVREDKMPGLSFFSCPFFGGLISKHSANIHN